MPAKGFFAVDGSVLAVDDWLFCVDTEVGLGAVNEKPEKGAGAEAAGAGAAKLVVGAAVDVDV